ncbi:unnamed protein product [Somion occarium]|uniref:Protein kinase domain-containing protein n=1 Tax=Somion occarium TaxID=3059160 RepID=A0ABP1DNB7_9APHY
MMGFFIGAAPYFDFLSLMEPSDPTWRDKSIPDLDLSMVPLGGVEKEMYQPFCDAVNDAGVCPGLQLVCLADTRDKEGCKLRPDLAVVPKNAADLDDFGLMELFAECKRRRDGDAFHESYNDKDIDLDSVEKIEGKSADSRGQLISYATATMSRQHRVFMFSISICGEFVRFLRWDRAGCIVSELINYLENPELVAEFFWRYSHMNAVERGFDVTVQRATKRQADVLTEAMDTFIEQSAPRNMEFLRGNMDPTYATYKVCIDDEKGRHRYFIIRQPFWDADSACGRATRAYAAYDMKQKKLVFLKDSWRTEDKDIMCEADIYEYLQENNVPFLLEVILAGDVMVHGRAQRTFSDQWSRPDSFPEWRLPCDRLRTHTHCRIVQELAYPVASAQSSREAVQVFRDVIESIRIAYQSAKMLHRDISTGNVMINKNGRGVLNDWDHGVRLILNRVPHSFRTGTWQFISVALLQEPSKSHEVHDDLESCFWVLLYISLHYFKHNGHQYRTFGGNLKGSLLTLSQLKKVRWECRPLDELIHVLAKTWKPLYDDDDDERRNLLRGNLDNVTPLLEAFDTALASEEWPEKDAVPNQYPRKRQRSIDQAIARAKTERIATVVRNTQALVTRTGSLASRAVPAQPAFAASALRPSSALRSDIPSVSSNNLPQFALPQDLSIGSKKRTVDHAHAEEPNVSASSSKRMKTGDPPLSFGQRPGYTPPALARSPTLPARLPPSGPSSPPARPHLPPAKPSPIDRLPSLPTVRHRYLTRSRTKPNKAPHDENGPKEALQEDVEMKQVEHRYPTRSKSNEKHPRPQPPPKPSTAKTQNGKKNNKPSGGNDHKGTPQEEGDTKQVEHRYPTRSKSNEKHPRPERPQKPLNAQAQTQQSDKRHNKSTTSDGRRTQARSKGRRQRR